MRCHRYHHLAIGLFVILWFCTGGLAAPATLLAQNLLPQSQAGDDIVIEMMQTGRNHSDSVVREELVFQVRAFDPREGDDDGDGIRSVDLIILDQDENELYRRREQNAGYCAFSGGEPNCQIYNFAENDNEWPNGEPVREGEDYTLRAIANARDGRQAFFETTIQIDLSESERQDLVVEMMQTGRNSTSRTVRRQLVFRVRAFDPTEGDDDGDGIENVDMIILDEDGREVYRRREQNAGYCAFSGGEPNCQVYNFANNNNRWPNGERIRLNEEYTLRAIVNAEDGRQATLETVIVIR